jgi:adenylylsulfate kinase
MSEVKATNVVWHEHNVSRSELEELHGHSGVTLWFTGLSASGKSTLANAVAAELHRLGVSTYVLDGDNIRHGLNKDLGFSPEERVENIRRIGEVAKLFTSAGVVNMTAFISPYESDRQLARQLQPESFIEVFCDAGLAVCEERDPKGAYKKARAGIIKQFTGIDAPYEAPKSPELRLDTGTQSVEACVAAVIRLIEERGIIRRSAVA